MTHPRAGWTYPFIEKARALDFCKVGIIVVNSDGSRDLIRVKLEDILPLAETIERNVRPHQPA